VNRTTWTTLGVIAALLVVGALISILLGLMWIAIRLAIVALAAGAVLWGLRSLAARRHSGGPATKR
jgi:hypothetical protein